jgi:mRNA-degrading endonuclease RelE of RelBE toxin-antitoxin system
MGKFLIVFFILLSLPLSARAVESGEPIKEMTGTLCEANLMGPTHRQNFNPDSDRIEEPVDDSTWPDLVELQSEVANEFLLMGKPEVDTILQQMLLQFEYTPEKDIIVSHATLVNLKKVVTRLNLLFPEAPDEIQLNHMAYWITFLREKIWMEPGSSPSINLIDATFAYEFRDHPLPDFKANFKLIFVRDLLQRLPDKDLHIIANSVMFSRQESHQKPSAKSERYSAFAIRKLRKIPDLEKNFFDGLTGIVVNSLDKFLNHFFDISTTDLDTIDAKALKTLLKENFRNHWGGNAEKSRVWTEIALGVLNKKVSGKDSMNVSAIERRIRTRLIGITNPAGRSDQQESTLDIDHWAAEMDRKHSDAGPRYVKNPKPNNREKQRFPKKLLKAKSPDPADSAKKETERANSPEFFEIEFSPSFEKQANKIGSNLLELIRKKVFYKRLYQQPYNIGKTVVPTLPSEYRVVGFKSNGVPFRLAFRIDENKVTLAAVGKRAAFYDRDIGHLIR